MNKKYEKSYDRIRALREDNDLTQKEIAAILNMSQTGYSKYETGENDVPTKILIDLAKYYDTSIDYLLGITDVKEPYLRSKKKLKESLKCTKKKYKLYTFSFLFICMC